MLDILKKELEVADRVKLYLSSGKELDVSILEIGEKHILVKNTDGTHSRFFEPIIGGWDLINRPEKGEQQLEQEIEPLATPVEMNKEEIEEVRVKNKIEPDFTSIKSGESKTEGIETKFELVDTVLEINKSEEKGNPL